MLRVKCLITMSQFSNHSPIVYGGNCFKSEMYYKMGSFFVFLFFFFSPAFLCGRIRHLLVVELCRFEECTSMHDNPNSRAVAHKDLGTRDALQ